MPSSEESGGTFDSRGLASHILARPTADDNEDDGYYSYSPRDRRGRGSDDAEPGWASTVLDGLGLSRNNNNDDNRRGRDSDIRDSSGRASRPGGLDLSSMLPDFLVGVIPGSPGGPRGGGGGGGGGGGDGGDGRRGGDDNDNNGGNSRGNSRLDRLAANLAARGRERLRDRRGTDTVSPHRETWDATWEAVGREARDDERRRQEGTISEKVGDVAMSAFGQRAEVTGVLGNVHEMEALVNAAGAAADGTRDYTLQVAGLAGKASFRNHADALRRATSRAKAVPAGRIADQHGVPRGARIAALAAAGFAGGGAAAVAAGAGLGGVGGGGAVPNADNLAGRMRSGADGVRAALGAARAHAVAGGGAMAQMSSNVLDATRRLGALADSAVQQHVRSAEDLFTAAGSADALRTRLEGFRLPEREQVTIDTRYNRRAEEVSTLLKRRAKAGSGALGILGVRFDIYRDFLQLQSLFFSAMDFPEVFRRFWGLLTTIIAIDIDFLFPTSALLFFWVTTILAWLLVAWLFLGALRKSDDVRGGVEARAWAQTKKWKRYGTQILLTLLLTLYLPVSRNSVQLFLCRLEPYLKPTPVVEVNAFGVERVTFPGDVCWTYHHVLHIIAGVTNIIAVTMLVPIKCYRLIRQHRPLQDEEHYTASGELVSSYTDAEYRLALAEDGSPYKFLYDGYEMRWSHYKVIVMVIKVSIILPVVIADDFRAQAAAVLAILSLFAALSFWSAPFIKDEDDRIDQVARTTTVLTVAGGLVAFELRDGARATLVFFLRPFFLIIFYLFVALSPPRLDFSHPHLATKNKNKQTNKTNKKNI
jgi:hypothetical protein